MPRRINDIPFRTRDQLNNTFQMITTNPADFTQLSRVAVTDFRGSGIFYSSLEPTINPEANTNLPNYIQNDIFLRDSAAGLQLYTWNHVDDSWSTPKKLNGIRLLDSSDFPLIPNLDLRITNLISNIPFEADYYLNNTLSLIFGGYDGALGFNFSAQEFNRYKAIRNVITFTYQGTDVIGYDDPAAYWTAFMADTGKTDLQKATYNFPTHGDTVHILLEGDEGHGGWLYTFDNGITANDPSQQVNYNLKFNADPADSTRKVHARQERVWSEFAEPVQNDKKYRQGDSHYDTDNGVLWSGYNEGIAPTTDLTVLFDNFTHMKGSSLLSAKDVNGDWEVPVKDDATYQANDYILTNTNSTPRIHGPYVMGAANDHEAWPLYTILRGSIVHDVTVGNIPTVFTGDYPTIDGVMVASGDTIREIYTPDVKIYEYYDGVLIDYNLKGMAWGVLRRPIHPTRVSYSSETLLPVRNDNIYYENEIVRNAVGDLFRYTEGQATDQDAFTQLENLKANVIFVVEDVNGDYVPTTVNDGSIGFIAQDNDTLEVRCTATGSTKVVLYTANVSADGTTITWIDRRSKFGQRTFEDTGFLDPTPSVDLYTEGDYVVTASGRRYEYHETSNNLQFSDWVRGSHIEVTNSLDNNFAPNIDNATGQVSGFGNMMVKTGDVAEIVITGSPTDKTFRYEVVQDFPIVLGPRTNVHPTRLFDRSSTNARPVADDSQYTNGDFVDNSVTGMRYGPYVENAPDDVTAWPDYQRIGGEDYSIDLGHQPNRHYLQNDHAIHDGSLYKARVALNGTSSPIPFNEADWDLVLQGVQDLRDSDNSKHTMSLVNGVFTVTPKP